MDYKVWGEITYPFLNFNRVCDYLSFIGTVDNITQSHMLTIYWKTEFRDPPPTPAQNVYHARTHFREKRGILSMGGANSQN